MKLQIFFSELQTKNPRKFFFQKKLPICFKTIGMPEHRQCISLLRSTFVNKNSQVQYARFKPNKVTITSFTKKSIDQEVSLRKNFKKINFNIRF